MAVGDMYRVVINQTLHGQVINNVLHYRKTEEGFIDGGALALAQRVDAVIVVAMKVQQSSELAHVNVLAQRIRPTPPLVPVLVNTNNGAGSVAGGSLPAADTVVITKRTPYAGRKFRGRVYVAGVPVTHEDNSTIAVAQLNNWQVLANTFAVNLTLDDDTWTPVVYHRSNFTHDVIVAAQVRNILRSQRRRQIGKGV